MTDAKEEMVEHWLLCRECGRESPRKQIPKSMMVKLAELNQPTQPSLGICNECQEQDKIDMLCDMEVEGNA